MQEIRKILDEVPDKKSAANWKKDMKGNIKHRELVSMFYNVKSIYNQQNLPNVCVCVSHYETLH